MVSELPTELRVDGVSLVSGLEDVVRTADAVVLVTRWAEYEQLPTLLARLDTPPALIDGRRMLPKASVDSYIGVGGG